MTIIMTTTSLPPVLTLRDSYLDNLALLGLGPGRCGTALGSLTLSSAITQTWSSG